MNSKLSKFYLLSFLLFSLANLSLHSATQQQAKGSISGRVIDAQGTPVYPATISIEGLTIGAYTNENGEYKLENIPSGKQTITISGIGVKPKKTAITVIANKTTEILDIEVDNSVSLSEVSVIGKSEARKQQEQAFAITVLDLKRAQVISIPLNRLLNNVSGVRVRQDGGVGSNYNFSLNGFSGNQVKFFLDGIPMDNFGPSFNLNNISTNMAERVEVYKGVLPVSLGADALGGAVNIVSRKDANYLDASYAIGSFNTHRAAINGAYTDSKTGFTVRANAFYNYSDNNYKVFAPIKDLNTNKIIDNRWVKRFHDNYEAGGIRLESGITNKSYADYLLAGVIVSKNDKDVQTGATMDAVYGGVKVKSESLIPSIRYKKDDLFTEGLSASFYGAYNSVNTFNIDTISRSYNWLGESIKDSTRGERAYTDSEIKNREWLSTANVSYMLDTHQSITLNHVFSSINRKIHDKVDPENESNKIPQKLTKNVTGLGWQIKYDRWNANVFGKLYNTNSSTYKRLDEYTENARLEKVKDSKTYFGYGAATTFFILPKLQAKLSYEQAYRLPESTEMFGDGLIQQRNPDLKAESSDNVNLGIAYEQHLNNEHILYFETNLIYRNTKDFILKGVSLTTDPTTAYENLGKVLTKGIEGGVKYRWKNLLHAGVNVTYQSIIDNQQFEKNSGSLVGEGIFEHISYKERLPNIPYFFANGDAGVLFQNVIIKNSELTLDYLFDYVQKYYLSFPGLGAKASKKVIPQQMSHDIALGYTLENGKYGFVLECTNITNEKLYDNYRLQKPGRAFNFKVRYFLR
ncbi:TonB-dependent receptor [Dysgonomonas sp. GY617]|uniref:TonB-dependent receptor n=1 Tax=Dysgonomonas sp. GY617 TaxID=2780420 RepID=UPI0018832B2F|nr:TonB-dependent receptor [Dysgonomonas sp. GY617]MBF0576980.1 TonB-dependent receptor [Dysgonomonas sp. GY617]